MSGDGLTNEGRESLRQHARDRPITCPRCGGHKQRVSGATLNKTDHFASIDYEICRGCGWEKAVRSRKKKSRLNKL